MIELKGVSKIYKSRKGSSTIALNNINLKIGNKGMLFIVGKSGSGKSTLLNLLGGLDNPTKGDILINNKNISKFNSSKYDSYRNIYIGFIFQEFNVLEQYNVYDNIQLALKLQNRKVLKEEIENLLNKLSLNDLEKRKINELSGGQKQRVAIARALIKQPEIILADEPTGNLDKASSEQIFNILKEISKDKLVIIVSHDMESANIYADRIVEVEDGNIVKDTNNFITDNIDNIQLKKSKLPFSYALKMTLTSLKTKPIKLFMTIILTAFSLVLMNLALNLSLFNKSLLITNTMKDNNNYVYSVYKNKFIKDTSLLLSLGKQDIEKIEKITNSKVNPVYNLYDKGEPLVFEFGENNSNNKYDSLDYLFNYIEINDLKILGKILGHEPKNYNEIVVHKYFADYAIKFGIKTYDNKLYFPKDYNDLINSKKELKLGDNKVIITGIIDDDDKLFKKYLDTKEDNYNLIEYVSDNYTSVAKDIYVKKFTDNAILNIDKKSIINYTSFNDEYGGIFISDNMNALNKNINILTKEGLKKINKLEKNEIIISLDSLKKFDKKFDSKFNDYILSNKSSNYELLLNKFIINYLNNYNTINLNLSIHVKEDLNNSINEKVKIIGISLDNNNYISYKYIDGYNPINKKIFSIKIYDNNTKNLRKTFNQLKLDLNQNETGVYYTYRVNNFERIVDIIAVYIALSKYLLIVSLVFMLFTFLLFSNFIGVSISYCKKEIGILRALGTRNKDIVKIFGYEAIIIGIIAWIISLFGDQYLLNLLNNLFFGNLYFKINGILNSPLVNLLIIIYILLIAIFITLVSINRITKIKPIDAINNK